MQRIGRKRGRYGEGEMRGRSRAGMGRRPQQDEQDRKRGKQRQKWNRDCREAATGARAGQKQEGAGAGVEA